MNSTNTILAVRFRTAAKAAIVLLSVPSLLMPSLGGVASAGSATPPTVPATPTPAGAPATEGSSTPPAEPAARPADPSLPVAVTPATPATPPAPLTGGPTAAPSPPPPKQAKEEEYNGPPLLLGDAKKKKQLGGYGGPTIAYSHMLHLDGVLVGAEGAVLIDHRLSFGGAGYVFSRSPSGPPAPDGTSREFFTGYGGVLLRYAVYSNIPLYGSFGTLIGGGAVTLAPRHHDDGGDNHDDQVETRGFFVLQPDVSLHVNATRWLRFGITFGYRFATAVDRFDFQGADMSGPVVGGNIQAGWF